MGETWEYKILHISAARWTDTGLPPELGQRFDQLGAQGWELVGLVPIGRPSLIPWGGSKTVGVVATFKRRRTS